MEDPHNRPVLTDGRVTLRAPRDRDVAERFALGRSPHILCGHGIEADAMGPFTQSDAEAWYAAYADQPHAFMIDHDGGLVGECRLHSVDATDRRATLAIGLLDEAKLGRGIGSAAMRLLLHYGFGALGLHRVALRVLDGNNRAIAAYRKLGFVEEGRLRENAWVAGRWRDDILMALLDRDFVQ